MYAREICNKSTNLSDVSCLEFEQFKWRPAPIGTKQDWHDRLRSIGIGKDNSSMSAPSYEENPYMINTKNDIETKVRTVGTFELEIKFGYWMFQ